MLFGKRRQRPVDPTRQSETLAVSSDAATNSLIQQLLFLLWLPFAPEEATEEALLLLDRRVLHRQDGLRQEAEVDVPMILEHAPPADVIEGDAPLSGTIKREEKEEEREPTTAMAGPSAP
jgi:hypothetical protein